MGEFFLDVFSELIDLYDQLHFMVHVGGEIGNEKRLVVPD
jgi:hypothetical protein